MSSNHICSMKNRVVNSYTKVLIPLRGYRGYKDPSEDLPALASLFISGFSVLWFVENNSEPIPYMGHNDGLFQQIY